MVEDNGVGIPEGKLAGILQERRSGSGIGLYNVQKRMLHFYGKGLDIQSFYGKGTRVVMEIPVREI